MINKSGNPPACACWRTPWSFLWRAWSPFHLRCRPGKGRGRILFAGRVTRTWVERICNLRLGKLKSTLKETLVWITCYSSFLHSYQSFLTLSPSPTQGREQVVKGLLAAGVEVNTTSPLNGNTGRLWQIHLIVQGPQGHSLNWCSWLSNIQGVPAFLAFSWMSLFQGCTLQLRVIKWRWSSC